MGLLAHKQRCRSRNRPASLLELGIFSVFQKGDSTSSGESVLCSCKDLPKHLGKGSRVQSVTIRSVG